MKRNYAYSNLAMLQTSNEVFTNILKHLPDFAAVSTRYTEAYVQTQLTEIRNAFDMLGVDMVSERSANRQTLVAHRTQFKKLLGTVLTSAKQGFIRQPEKYDLLIKPLEVNRFMKSDSDEAIMELALNVTGSLVSQLALYAAAGIPTTLTDSLRQSAVSYSESYKSQNSQNKRASSVSSENQAILNDIYTEALGISAIARNIYAADRSKLKLFSFSGIAKNYAGSSRKRNTSSSGTSETEDFAQSIAEAIAPIIEDKMEQELLIVNGH